MFSNNLIDPTLVQNFGSEYLSHVARYVHLNRSGIFCRYFNIDHESSSVSKESLSANDTYFSGIKYNIYEYTPTLNVSEIIDTPQHNEDLIGQMYEGSGNITLFTIKRPNKDDLVMFPYQPIQIPHIFRVNDYRVVLQSIKTSPPIYIYELMLEYAPITDVRELDIMNQYVYNLVLRKYMMKSDFLRMLRDYKALQRLLDYLQETYFDKNTELYYYQDPDRGWVYPLAENTIIHDFLINVPGDENYFHSILRPFGIMTYGKTGYYDKHFKPIDNYEKPLLSQFLQLDFDDVLEDLIADTECSQSKYKPTDTISTLKIENCNVFSIAKLIESWHWTADDEINGEYPKDSRTHKMNISALEFDQKLNDLIYSS